MAFDPSESLLIQIIGGTPADREVVALALQRKSCRSVASVDAKSEINLADPPPGLLLLIAPPDLSRLAMDIRSMGGWHASVPVLACTTGAMATPDGCDAILRLDEPAAKMDALIDNWLPPDPLAGMRRLVTQFGTEHILPLVQRLRGELDEAVHMLDDGGILGSGAHAHTIAGVAGTLGFTQVSDSWRRLSEGEVDAMADARRTARVAISAIDRLQK